jgi:hypothetical protein
MLCATCLAMFQNFQTPTGGRHTFQETFNDLATSLMMRQSSPHFAGAPSHTHVTHRRSTHPRFTLASPILTCPHYSGPNGWAGPFLKLDLAWTR